MPEHARGPGPRCFRCVVALLPHENYSRGASQFLDLAMPFVRGSLGWCSARRFKKSRVRWRLTLRPSTRTCTRSPRPWPAGVISNPNHTNPRKRGIPQLSFYYVGPAVLCSPLKITIRAVSVAPIKSTPLDGGVGLIIFPEKSFATGSAEVALHQ